MKLGDFRMVVNQLTYVLGKFGMHWTLISVIIELEVTWQCPKIWHH